MKVSEMREKEKLKKQQKRDKQKDRLKQLYEAKMLLTKQPMEEGDFYERINKSAKEKVKEIMDEQNHLEYYKFSKPTVM